MMILSTLSLTLLNLLIVVFSLNQNFNLQNQIHALQLSAASSDSSDTSSNLTSHTPPDDASLRESDFDGGIVWEDVNIIDETVAGPHASSTIENAQRNTEGGGNAKLFPKTTTSKSVNRDPEAVEHCPVCTTTTGSDETDPSACLAIVPLHNIERLTSSSSTIQENTDPHRPWRASEEAISSWCLQDDPDHQNFRTNLGDIMRNEMENLIREHSDRRRRDSGSHQRDSEIDRVLVVPMIIQSNDIPETSTATPGHDIHIVYESEPHPEPSPRSEILDFQQPFQSPATFRKGLSPFASLTGGLGFYVVTSDILRLPHFVNACCKAGGQGTLMAGLNSYVVFPLWVFVVGYKMGLDTENSLRDVLKSIRKNLKRVKCRVFGSGNNSNDRTVTQNQTSLQNVLESNDIDINLTEIDQSESESESSESFLKRSISFKSLVGGFAGCLIAARSGAISWSPAILSSTATPVPSTVLGTNGVISTNGVITSTSNGNTYCHHIGSMLDCNLTLLQSLTLALIKAGQIPIVAGASMPFLIAYTGSHLTQDVYHMIIETNGCIELPVFGDVEIGKVINRVLSPISESSNQSGSGSNSGSESRKPLLSLNVERDLPVLPAISIMYYVFNASTGAKVSSIAANAGIKILGGSTLLKLGTPIAVGYVSYKLARDVIKFGKQSNLLKTINSNVKELGKKGIKGLGYILLNVGKLPGKICRKCCGRRRSFNYEDLTGAERSVLEPQLGRRLNNADGSYTGAGLGLHDINPR